MGDWGGGEPSGIEANVKQWLEDAEERFGEPIEAIVCLGEGEGGKGILPRDEGLAKLDRTIDAGHGTINSEPMYAWSASRVFFIHEYDGQLRLAWLPRNPATDAPEFGGYKNEV